VEATHPCGAAGARVTKELLNNRQPILLGLQQNIRALTRRRDDATQSLGVRDGYRYIGLSRSGGDGAILA